MEVRKKAFMENVELCIEGESLFHTHIKIIQEDIIKCKIDKTTLSTMIEYLRGVITSKSEEVTGDNKYYSLFLIKHLLEMGRKDIVNLIGEKMLEPLMMIHSGKVGQLNTAAGQKYYRLALECLQELGNRFENPVFQQEFKKLTKEPPNKPKKVGTPTRMKATEGKDAENGDKSIPQGTILEEQVAQLVGKKSCYIEQLGLLDTLIASNIDTEARAVELMGHIPADIKNVLKTIKGIAEVQDSPEIRAIQFIFDQTEDICNKFRDIQAKKISYNDFRTKFRLVFLRITEKEAWMKMEQSGRSQSKTPPSKKQATVYRRSSSETKMMNSLKNQHLPQLNSTGKQSDKETLKGNNKDITNTPFDVRSINKVGDYITFDPNGMTRSPSLVSAGGTYQGFGLKFDVGVNTSPTIKLQFAYDPERPKGHFEKKVMNVQKFSQNEGSIKEIISEFQVEDSTHPNTRVEKGLVPKQEKSLDKIVDEPETHAANLGAVGENKNHMNVVRTSFEKLFDTEDQEWNSLKKSSLNNSILNMLPSHNLKHSKMHNSSFAPERSQRNNSSIILLQACKSTSFHGDLTSERTKAKNEGKPLASSIIDDCLLNPSTKSGNLISEYSNKENIMNLRQNIPIPSQRETKGSQGFSLQEKEVNASIKMAKVIPQDAIMETPQRAQSNIQGQEKSLITFDDFLDFTERKLNSGLKSDVSPLPPREHPERCLAIKEPAPNAEKVITSPKKVASEIDLIQFSSVSIMEEDEHPKKSPDLACNKSLSATKLPGKVEPIRKNSAPNLQSFDLLELEGPQGILSSQPSKKGIHTKETQTIVEPPHNFREETLAYSSMESFRKTNPLAFANGNSHQKQQLLHHQHLIQLIEKQNPLVETLSKDMEEVKQRCLHLTQDIDTVKRENVALHGENEAKSFLVSRLKADVEEMKRGMADLSAVQKVMQKDKEDLVKEVGHLVKENHPLSTCIEIFENRLSSSMSKEVPNLLENRAKAIEIGLMKKNEDQETRVKELEQKIAFMQQEIHSIAKSFLDFSIDSKFQIDSLKQENEELKKLMKPKPTANAQIQTVVPAQPIEKDHSQLGSPMDLRRYSEQPTIMARSLLLSHTNNATVQPSPLPPALADPRQPSYGKINAQTQLAEELKGTSTCDPKPSTYLFENNGELFLQEINKQISDIITKNSARISTEEKNYKQVQILKEPHAGESNPPKLSLNQTGKQNLPPLASFHHAQENRCMLSRSNIGQASEETSYLGKSNEQANKASHQRSKSSLTPRVLPEHDGYQTISNNVIDYDPSFISQALAKVHIGKGKYELDDYRYACLRAKATLFENSILQIGVITTFSPINPKQLKIVFHYGNKSNSMIEDFNCSIDHDGISVTPSGMKQSSLEAKNQYRQEVQVEFPETDKFQVATLELTFKYRGIINNITLPLPMTANKFAEHESISVNDAPIFNEMWENVIEGSQKFKTQPRLLNTKIVKNEQDFQKFFSEMKQVPAVHDDQIRFLGKFKLHGDLEFMYRITFENTHKTQPRVFFEIASLANKEENLEPDEMRAFCELFLNTWTFIFTK